MEQPSLSRDSDPVPPQNEVFTLGWLLRSIQGESGRRRDVSVCEGLKVNQQEKLTPHKYLARDFKTEITIRKITIIAAIQKKWLKYKKSDYNLAPVGQGGGHGPIKQCLQFYCGCSLVKSSGPGESLVLL